MSRYRRTLELLTPQEYTELHRALYTRKLALRQALNKARRAQQQEKVKAIINQLQLLQDAADKLDPIIPEYNPNDQN